METSVLVPAAVFVPLLVVAVTQLVKKYVTFVSGELVVVVALIVGGLAALVDTHIGVQDFSVAQGVVLAAGAVGLNILAAKAGGGASGDESVQR